MTRSVASVVNPPAFLTIFAIWLADAIIDGSSTAIGTVYSLSFIKKFKPKPSGNENDPITFSIILSALSKCKDAKEQRSCYSDSDNLCILLMSILLSLTYIL